MIKINHKKAQKILSKYNGDYPLVWLMRHKGVFIIEKEKNRLVSRKPLDMAIKKLTILYKKILKNPKCCGKNWRLGYHRIWHKWKRYKARTWRNDVVKTNKKGE